MADPDARWLQLKATFRSELEERPRVFNELLLRLERGVEREQERIEILQALFRGAHSLKGAARAVEAPHIERVAHELETVIESAAREGHQLTGDWFGAAFSKLSALTQLTAPVEQRTESPVLSMAAPPLPAESARVAVDKLDALLAQAGELTVTHLRIEQRQKQLRADLGVLMRLVDRVDQPMREALERADELGAQLRRDSAELATASRAIGDGVMAIRLVAADTLFGSFERMVRDLARDLGKQVHLVVDAGRTELDRKILEGLRDPLMHMLRNAVDHGIESPDVRLARAKPAAGTIRLTAAQRSGLVEVNVEDDGAGLDPARLRRWAIARGLLSEEQAAALGDDEARDLIFRPGFSTSAVVSETSGRGVGMDVVREHVERLGGHVRAGGVPGQGASFSILVPLTLATSRAILAEHHGQIFAIPSLMVERSARLRLADVVSIRGRRATIVDGHPLPIVELAAVLGAYRGSVSSLLPSGEWRPYFVLRQADIRVAVLVDRLVGEQELVVKRLGWPLRHARYIEGGAVLSSGATAIILNPSDVIKTAWHLVTRGVTVEVEREPSREGAVIRPKRRLLVVDDSLTTRTLERSIFEAAGYQVVVASDGVEALSCLNGDSIDAVVSDIEMPRMDGFALTAAIRRDERLRHLPVVLVTSLDAREHRERGVAVGADAYIVKSRFEQGQLLETVGRLIAA